VSLKRLSVAWALSVSVLALVVTARVLLTARLGASGATRLAWAALDKIENGAVVSTFFLTCFLVAQAVHILRTRRNT
jgi:hypothetical protein